MNVTKKNDRNIGLDWLRGLMACSIMCYHYNSWLFSHTESESIMGKLGIYGVCTFYILSGLSLALIYNNSLNNFISLKNFLIRRVFRIVPLMWIATFSALFFQVIDYGRIVSSSGSIFNNLTVFFGFYKPADYIPVGAWSIGNEMVYYLFTPIIVFFYNRNLMWGNIFYAITVFIGLLFAFLFITPTNLLSDQWLVYINPFNNLFLFTTGFFIFYNFNRVQLTNLIGITILIIACLLFVYYPVSGNQINLVTGITRMSFVYICAILVLIFWKFKFSFQIIIDSVLTHIGMATYSIYLLHPIVFRIYRSYLWPYFHSNNNTILFISAMIITITLSYFVYKYFEEPFIKLGKKLTMNPKVNL